MAWWIGKPDTLLTTSGSTRKPSMSRKGGLPSTCALRNSAILKCDHDHVQAIGGDERQRIQPNILHGRSIRKVYLTRWRACRGSCSRSPLMSSGRLLYSRPGDVVRKRAQLTVGVLLLGSGTMSFKQASSAVHLRRMYVVPTTVAQ